MKMFITTTTTSPAKTSRSILLLWWFLLLQGGDSTTTTTNHHIRHHRHLFDAVAPTLTCNENVQLSLTGTSIAVVLGDVELSAGDNVGITSTVFNAPGSPYGCGFIGQTDVVTVTVKDAAGNSATCEADVTVVDRGLPTAICASKTIPLGATSPGTATITTADINNGSTDNCDSSLSLSLSKTSFTCADVGAAGNPVTLTATDDNSNSAACTATVTVVDNTPPTLNCPSSGTVKLISGTATVALTGTGGIVSATDNCGVGSILPATVTYGCADVGTKPVRVTATDVNGNTDTCSFNYRVFEEDAPVAQCVAGPIELGITAASVSLSATQVNAGSTDNCAISTITLSKTSFGCADIGSNTVTLTVTDTSGNTDTCSVIVNVDDTESPDVDCVDRTVSVGSTGLYVLTQADVLNNGDPADDNCGEPTLEISRTSFSCTDVGLPPTTVTVTATDRSDNQNSCTSKITVRDTTGPVIGSCPNQTINLSATGTATINKALYTVTDNCGVKSGSPTFSKDSFTCANRGTNPITVTATDVNSNTATCSPTITIVDNTNPVLTCPPGIAVPRTAGQNSLVIPFTRVTATDNCGTATLSAPPLAFDCNNSSLSRTVTITATDAANNKATCVVPIEITGDTTLDCSGGSILDVVIGVLTCGLV